MDNRCDVASRNQSQSFIEGQQKQTNKERSATLDSPQKRNRADSKIGTAIKELSTSFVQNLKQAFAGNITFREAFSETKLRQNSNIKQINSVKSEINKFEQQAAEQHKLLSEIQNKEQAIKQKESTLETKMGGLHLMDKKIERESNKSMELAIKINELKSSNADPTIIKEEEEKLARHIDEKGELSQTVKSREKLDRDISGIKNGLDQLKSELGDIKSKFETKKNELSNNLTALKEMPQDFQNISQGKINRLSQRIEKLFEKHITVVNHHGTAETKPRDNTPKPLPERHQEIKSFIQQPGFNSRVAQSHYLSLQKEAKIQFQESVNKGLTVSTHYETATEAKEKTSGVKSSGPAPVITNETLKSEAIRVVKEAENLKKLVDKNPTANLGQENQKLLETLKKVIGNSKNLSPEGKEAFLNDLKQLSDTIKLIEGEVIQHQQVKGLEKQATLNELNNIKKNFESANQINGKIVIELENGIPRMEVKERLGTNLTGRPTPAAFQTVLSILQNLSHSVDDPDQHKVAADILTLMKQNKWASEVINDKDYKIILNSSIEAIISAKQTGIVSSGLLPGVLSPPSSSAMEKSFLTTYRSLIKEITGDAENKNKSLPDSVRLFNFINEKFKDPATPLFAKQQLLKLAEQWVSSPFINNNETALVKTQLEELATAAKNEASPILNEFALKLEKSIIEGTKATSEPVQIPEGTKSATHLVSDIANGDLHSSSSGYENAVNEFAQSLTAQSEILFRALNSSEFKNAKWLDPKVGAIQSPTIKKITDDFNALSNFVTQSIIEPNGDKPGGMTLNQKQDQSARVLKFFIDVQTKLISKEGGSVDFNSFMAIQGAISGSSIRRLEKIKEKLPPETKTASQAYEKLASPDSNFKEYRSAENSTTTPFVPYIATHLKDLTGGEEIQSETASKEVNFEKIQILGKTINAIQDMQGNLPATTAPAYNLGGIAEVVNKYTNSEGKYDEMAMYKKSQLLEPKNEAVKTPFEEIQDKTKNMILRPDFQSETVQNEYKKLQSQGDNLLENSVENASNPREYETQPASGKTYPETPLEKFKQVSKELKPIQKLVEGHLKQVNERMKQAEGNTALKKHLQVFQEQAKKLQAYTDKVANTLGSDHLKSQIQILAEGNILSPAGLNALSDHIQQISDTAKLIEAEVLHSQEVEGLSDPGTVAQREMESIKTALEKANANDEKLVLKEENGSPRVETQARESGPEFRAGTSKEARKMVEFLMGKLEKSIKDPNLVRISNEIIGLMKKNGWVQSVMKNNQGINNVPGQAERLKTIENDLRSVQPSPINALTKLLSPPSDPAFDKSFLIAYPVMIGKMVGPEGGTTDAEKLIFFIKREFEKPETSLYGKQQLLKLAEQWASTPFVNKNEVSAVKDQVAGLIQIAQKEELSVLNPLVVKLGLSLKNSVALEQKALESTQKISGETKGEDGQGVSAAIDKIANGKMRSDSPEYKKFVNDFALSLTAQSENQFRSLTASDFKQVENKWGENIQKNTNNFNQLSIFVTMSILKRSNIGNNDQPMTPEDQTKVNQEIARVIEFFVDIQEQLISSKNHSIDLDSFMAINSALTQTSVSRLSKAKELLPQKTKEMMISNRQLTTIEKNKYLNLKKLMSSSPIPVVPFFGGELTEIVFANEMNTKVDVKTNGKETEVVNGLKVSILGKIIGGIEDKQKKLPDPLAPVIDMNDIQELGKQYNEEEADLMSKKIELPTPRKLSNGPPQPVQK